MNILDKLNWRYATKKFKTQLSISESKMEVLKKAIQFAPSSFGLQPFQVIFVKSPEIREKLKSAAWGQPQITDASLIAIFVRKKDINEKDVDLFIENVSNTRNIPIESISEYSSMIKNSIKSKNKTQRGLWIEKQIYISLGFLLNTASLIDVDACPMEGFDREKFDEILELKNTTSVVICALGYRDDTDEYQNYKKVRKSDEDLFKFI